MGIWHCRVSGNFPFIFLLFISCHRVLTDRTGQYLVAPHDAIKTQAESDGTTLTTSKTDSTSKGADAAGEAALAMVFINADSGEGYLTVEDNEGDRNHLNAWHKGSDLVAAVAKANANTIVVIHSVGPVLLESFIELDNVVAVVWAGLPGQESGNALVDVLYGSTAPNGKLPYTIGKTADDYGTHVVQGDDDYPEGLFIDYRHFDAEKIEPRFEFGFGLCKGLSFCFRRLLHNVV